MAPNLVSGYQARLKELEKRLNVQECETEVVILKTEPDEGEPGDPSEMPLYYSDAELGNDLEEASGTESHFRNYSHSSSLSMQSLGQSSCDSDFESDTESVEIPVAGRYAIFFKILTA